MVFKHLSEKFYNDYPAQKFPELMLKENRPYTQVITDINGLKFAIPLRSIMQMSYGPISGQDMDWILQRLL